MSKVTRRTFNRVLGAAAAVGISAPATVSATKAKVVVVGGGFGGATAAKYLKQFDAGIDVTLVTPLNEFITCPFSNTVIGGLNNLEFITQNYKGMKKRGVTVVNALATQIDSQKKQVTLNNGSQLAFDRCIVSPGIDFRWDKIHGMKSQDSNRIPHAWTGGAQTTLLRQQLKAMPNGGTFVISPPDNPFRCPPGPAERISLVAHYFKHQKPKSKIVVLDPKRKFSKQAIFKEGWDKLYKGMIDYHNVDNDGVIQRVDVKNMTLHGDFDKYKGDVINLIPAQQAGKIAKVSGLTDATGWCPIDHKTFESTLQSGVHVVGDATIAAPMPKSGFSASTQGKVCAAAVASLLAGKAPGSPKLVNICYSLVAPEYGISIAMVYGYQDGKIVEIKEAGGLSPTGADNNFRKQEALYADGWYRSITNDIWG
jgi:sulfide dehydrogenase [flavocytochrome c] flavoprotein chain